MATEVNKSDALNDQHRQTEKGHVELLNVRDAATQNMLAEVECEVKKNQKNDISQKNAAIKLDPVTEIVKGNDAYNSAFREKDQGKREKDWEKSAQAYQNAITLLKDSNKPDDIMVVGELSRFMGDVRFQQFDYVTAKIFYNAAISIDKNLIDHKFESNEAIRENSDLSVSGRVITNNRIIAKKEFEAKAQDCDRKFWPFGIVAKSFIDPYHQSLNMVENNSWTLSQLVLPINAQHSNKYETALREHLAASF